MIGGLGVAAAWLPFVLADPRTLAAGSPTIITAQATALHVLGLHGYLTWVRAVQLAVSVAAGVVAVPPRALDGGPARRLGRAAARWSRGRSPTTPRALSCSARWCGRRCPHACRAAPRHRRGLRRRLPRPVPSRLTPLLPYRPAPHRTPRRLAAPGGLRRGAGGGARSASTHVGAGRSRREPWPLSTAPCSSRWCSSGCRSSTACVASLPSSSCSVTASTPAATPFGGPARRWSYLFLVVSGFSLVYSEDVRRSRGRSTTVGPSSRPAGPGASCPALLRRDRPGLAVLQAVPRDPSPGRVPSLAPLHGPRPGSSSLPRAAAAQPALPLALPVPQRPALVDRVRGTGLPVLPAALRCLAPGPPAAGRGLGDLPQPRPAPGRAVDAVLRPPGLVRPRGRTRLRLPQRGVAEGAHPGAGAVRPTAAALVAALVGRGLVGHAGRQRAAVGVGLRRRVPGDDAQPRERAHTRPTSLRCAGWGCGPTASTRCTSRCSGPVYAGVAAGPPAARAAGGHARRGAAALPVLVAWVGYVAVEKPSLARVRAVGQS